MPVKKYRQNPASYNYTPTHDSARTEKSCYNIYMQ